MKNNENKLGDFTVKDLKVRTLKGGSIVLVNMFLQKGVLLAIYATLARLLTPRDYGIFGMVFAVTIFLNIFSSGGLSQASVQKYDLNHQQLSTIFWLNQLLGLALCAVMASTGPFLAWFYKEPILINVTSLMALAFPLGSIGSQQGALLSRRMDYGRLSISRTVSLIVGGAVGILMAWYGFGIYSLVAQVLVQTSTASIANWLLSKWTPGLPVKGCGIRGMVRFGGYLTGFYFINYFSGNLDRILIGRFSGADSLGLYTRAHAIMMYPVGLISEPISSIMFPVFARLQHDKNRLKELSGGLLKLITFLVFPMMAWLILSHENIILIIYGSQWIKAAPIFAVLCIVGIFQSYHFLINQIYVSIGKADLQFKIGIITTMIFCFSFIIGMIKGPIGVAIAFALGHIVIIIPYLKYFCKTIGIKMNNIAFDISVIFLSSLIMYFCQKLINTYSFISGWGPLAFIAFSSFSAMVIYLLISLISNRRMLYEFINYLKIFVRPQNS